MGRRCHVVWTVVAIVSMATVARGQCETGKVVPSDGVVGDQFGAAVDLNGGWLIAGAPGRDFGVGAAYVYERMGTSWVERALLVPSNPVGFDDFGRSVAITGLYAAVGMPKGDVGPNSDIGLVQVYRRSGTAWILEGFDNQPGVAAFSEFGTSVSLFGDGLLAGAPNSDGVNTTGLGNSGSAYIYRRNASFNRWDHEVTLTASDAAELDTFGAAVKLQGNWAFVGAPGDKDPVLISPSNTVGAVYVFLKQGATWIQVQKLVASDAVQQTANRQFGAALDCDGEVLIVGERQGQSAYVFRRVGNTWAEEAILKKPAVNAAGIDQFARAVAIEGDLALVGAPFDDDNGLSNSGTMFAYRRIGGAWTAQSLIYASDRATSHRFGVAVAIDGSESVAGALQVPVGTGAVYFYSSAIEADCNLNGQDDRCELHADPSLDQSGNGVLDACDCKSDGDCDDSLACTVDTCDVITGSCLTNPIFSYCAIDGQCIAHHESNTANDCELCDVNIATLDWSPIADGTSCGESTLCMNGVCLAGICTLAPGSSTCVINGECVAAGAMNPDNQCEHCNPAASTSAWSARPNGASCDAPPAECKGPGACQAGNCTATLLYVGAPCGNPALTECDRPDTCSATGFCLLNWVTDGTVCTENGVFCDGVGICGQGVCGGPVTPPCTLPGKPFCDESQDACFECLEDGHCTAQHECRVNFCSIIGTCGTFAVPNGTPCGDASSTECDSPDSCSSGTCATNPRPNGTYCTGNGVFCDGVQSCQTGICTGPVFDPCAATPTSPICSEEAESCVRCQFNAQCDDQLPCTTDTCGPLGTCAHTKLPVGAHCGPQVADDCALRGRCNTFGICVDSVASNGSACIDDSDPCTLDYCENAACVHRMEALDSPCGLDDCNCNALPDECEMVGGLLADCDGNGYPDECELPFFFASSERLSPIGYGHIQEFTIPEPPNAVGQVTFVVYAMTDLFSSGEWIEVFLNGTELARLFSTGANDCPTTPDVRSIQLDSTEFNMLVSGGDAEVLLLPGNSVNADLCGPDSHVRVELRYEATGPHDCNVNLIPDKCELADGSELDVDPEDGRLDSCAPPTCLNQLTSGLDCRIQVALGEIGPSTASAFVQLEMDGNCPVADLRPDHFDVIDSRPTESQPYIVDVTVLGSTITVQLSQLPQPFGWTCVSLRGSGKGSCVGLLPADLNGDQVANYLDVEVMASCCMDEACEVSAASNCDLNESAFSDAEDLIVLINFLNGAENFDMLWGDFHFLSSCPILCGGPENFSCSISNLPCRPETGACNVYDKPMGLCLNPPYFCLPFGAPVCGCDGGTYPNECEAHRAGVSIAHDGPCP